MFKALLLVLACFSISGCFLAPDEEAFLRTVPVTNNPHVVPNHGTMPGIPTGME